MNKRLIREIFGYGINPNGTINVYSRPGARSRPNQPAAKPVQPFSLIGYYLNGNYSCLPGVMR